MDSAPNNNNAGQEASLDKDIIQLPKETVVLAEHNGTVLVASKSTPMLYEIDTSNGERAEYNLKFIPRVAIELPDETGFAVFGDHGEPKKQSSWTFAIVNNRVASHLETSEPLTVGHAATWYDPENGHQLVLSDIKSRTLAFLSLRQIQKILKSGNGDVDIRRLSLDDNPFDIVLISDRYIVISYLNEKYLDIIDLYEGGSIGRSYSKINYRRSYLYGYSEASDDRFFFTLDQRGELLSVHQLQTLKGAWIQEISTLEVNLVHAVSENTHEEFMQAVPFYAKRDGSKIWTASNNKAVALHVGLTLADRLHKPSLQVLGSVRLPMNTIDQIVPLPNTGEILFHSSSEHQAVIVQEIDLLNALK